MSPIPALAPVRQRESEDAIRIHRGYQRVIMAAAGKIVNSIAVAFARFEPGTLHPAMLG